MKKLIAAPVLGLYVLLYCLSFTACTPEPEIITETIIERDTVVVVQNDTLFITEQDTVVVVDTVTLTTLMQDTVTTFILLRHAETTGVGTDPDLSMEGLLRAEDLRQMLMEMELAAVFSTDAKRSMQTAEVVAEDQSVPVEIYDPFNLNPLIADVLENDHQQNVLVVGHSNTTPNLLNLLVGSNVYDLIPETEYDNIYVVSVLEKGRAEVLHLKY